MSALYRNAGARTDARVDATRYSARTASGAGGDSGNPTKHADVDGTNRHTGAYGPVDTWRALNAQQVANLFDLMLFIGENVFEHGAGGRISEGDILHLVA